MLQAILGVNRDGAQRLLAELVANMSRLPAAAHPDPWAGIYSGKRERAAAGANSRLSVRYSIPLVAAYHMLRGGTPYSNPTK
jgi:hypothetical protein